MERIGFLINKLKEQYEKAEKRDNMLVTLQMLYREMQPKIDGAALIRNVAIVVPGQMDLSFLEKTIEQKMALDLTPNAEGKQVFELSVEPVSNELPVVSSELSTLESEKPVVADESQMVTTEMPALHNEPLDTDEKSLLDVHSDLISVTRPSTKPEMLDVKPETPEVKPEIFEVKPKAPDFKPETPVPAPQQVEVERESIDLNDSFNQQETLNSRFTVQEKDSLATANSKNDTSENPASNFAYSESISRFLPPQPPSKPEPPPVVEVPIFTKPPAVVTTDLPVKELHETISVPAFTSFNDKQEKRQPELFHTLKAEPLKDLKKAISINDRFQYISHLFMGDETVYERSIKTINHFNVYSEAEFWIRRELSTKMGWDKEDTVVQQFMQLVQRRFP